MKDFMNALTAWIYPGNSIVVYKDREEVFRYQSGFANLEKAIPMGGEELFNIYSCSKVATVVSALQLYERGRFLLSDPLSEFFPEYRDMYVRDAKGRVKKAENPITLRHLFTMTAGFSYDMNTATFQRARDLTQGRMDTLSVIRCLAEDPLSFEPGSHWQYSLCHDVLAAVVELVSGMRFCDYVRKNIFEPLGMADSYYHLTPQLEARMAEQYTFVTADSAGQRLEELQSAKQSDQGVVQNVGKSASYRLGSQYDSGGAGIITSVCDYAKFACALANGGVGPNGERILSAGTIELLRANQLGPVQLEDYNWPQLAGYGYGLGVRTMMDRARSGSNGSVGEFGWGGAAGANVLVDPDRHVSLFFAQHMLNPHEEHYQPRLRNVLYACLQD